MCVGVCVCMCVVCQHFFKLATNNRSDKMFLMTLKVRPQGVVSHYWHQNFVPRGYLPLTCGYIHLLRLKRFFLNLQQMTIVMRPSCWHKKFGPNGLSAPTQGLCLNFFSSITADFNTSSALRWAIQDQWSSGLNLFCGLTPQSTTMVMLRRSVNVTTLFLVRLRP